MSSYTSAHRANADFRREAHRLRVSLPPILLDCVWSLPLHPTTTARRHDQHLLEAKLHRLNSRYWEAETRTQATAGETAADYMPGSEIEDDQDNTFGSRFLSAFWRLCEQRIATVTTNRTRSATRKTGGKPRPPADVRVVNHGHVRRQDRQVRPPDRLTIRSLQARDHRELARACLASVRPTGAGP